MKQVLYIGCYDKTGRFTSHNWKVFLDFLKERGTKIEILVTHSNDKIKNVVEVTEISNSELLMYTIKVNEQSIKMLLSLNCDIDSSGIEYMFFYDNDDERACLNITDYENYVVIDEKINTDGLILRGINIDDNCFVCKEHVYDIDALVEESWTPLGVS
mgnify:CR=1 FL=1